MKLYVGNLSKEVTEAELSALAQEFGQLTSSKVARERSGESKGFGFLEYGTPEAGTAAIAALDGKEIGGMALKVAQAKNQTPVDPLGGRF
ncbi:MAG TPA: RNA-binding protein [Thermoanaerobaculia bacterium]|nr:RNA-binding protein [Thermoanaerobaculia bacterium]